MGVFKTADGRSLVGIGQQDGNEYNGFAGWRDCVIQLTASGATEDSVKYLNAIKDYAVAHNAKGESIMPPNLSIWISNNGVTTAVQADDITVDEANVTICGIKWNGTAWDYTDAGKGSGSVSASSLADLSDVEIDTPMNANRLLKYNDSTKKWENVSSIKAILSNSDPWHNQGAMFINDAEEILTLQSAIFPPSTQEAASLAGVVEAAITYGHIQVDNQSKNTFRPLILSAENSVFFNVPLYLGVGSGFGINESLALESATSNYATFVGTTFYNSNFYRITLTVWCPDTADVATILAKAEELMTLTEPT